ncbi:uncharacterized protein LOC130790129 [Actinidia eriantha]|uniref:uncharacterized protein LOC130790129 n=1 Tax=Actinidia eriantha TaxID=165200 RepID=UPI00258E9155|nr:uncharacterized protein LOC130790129 [Actinidia eriantha]
MRACSCRLLEDIIQVLGGVKYRGRRRCCLCLEISGTASVATMELTVTTVHQKRRRLYQMLGSDHAAPSWCLLEAARLQRENGHENRSFILLQGDIDKHEDRATISTCACRDKIH